MSVYFRALDLFVILASANLLFDWLFAIDFAIRKRGDRVDGF